MLESGLLRIITEEGVIVGTGFLISKAHVLTCAHVVCVALGIDATTKAPPNKTVRLSFPFFPGNPKHRAKVEAWYTAKEQVTFGELEDIALLHLESDPYGENFFPKSTKPLKLTSSENNVASNLKVCGFPRGFNYGDTIELKLLSTKAQGWVKIDSVSPNKTIVNGFSGAPVWSENSREVLGMVVASRATEHDKVKNRSSYMIPASLLHKVSKIGELAVS